MWIILYMLILTYANTEDCWQHVNYAIPQVNNTTLDLCNDGECWTYCDHEKWYNINFENYEYTEKHLKQEQFDCIETGCADFYYGNFNLQLLEECVSAKCQISHHIIENSRQCSTIIIDTSNVYKELFRQKTNYKSITDFQRSMTDYSKTALIMDINNIIGKEKYTMEQLHLINDQLREFLPIKDTKAEQQMLESIQININELNASTETDLRYLANEVFKIRTELYGIYLKMEYDISLGAALQVTKDFINERRDQIVRYFVWQNETCIPLTYLDKQIEDVCSICSSHGTCKFTDYKFTCQCEPGWKGETCEIEKRACVDYPCLHDSKCIDESSLFRCECPDNSTGTFCQKNINITAGCTENPCQNNGICLDQEDGYKCECPFNFVGKNCQYAVVDCLPSPCVHGTCKTTGTRISCDCDQEPIYRQPFWIKETCDTPQTNCDYRHSTYVSGVLIHGHPCSGHGACELDTNATSWSCTCDRDYIGNRCGVHVDDADSCLLFNKPCIHGNCDNCHSNSTTCKCECDAGWEGAQCSFDIDDCNPNPCKNGATCIDMVDDYYCDCSYIKKPWTGRYCELPADGCLHGPCGTPEQHQTCEVDWTSTSGIQCHCNPGWWGNRCEINAAKCYEGICLHEGSCIQGLYAFCNCPQGWEGTRCEIPVEYCNDNPCGSNGACKSTPGGFECHCFDGWAGKRCNENINECKNNTCLNGGSCIDRIYGYECSCIDDWTGQHCELLKTSCENVDCENHGICVDTRHQPWTKNTYECACTKGFSGVKCTINPSTTFSFTLMIGIGVGIIIISCPTCLIFWTRFKQAATRSKRHRKIHFYK